MWLEKLQMEVYHKIAAFICGRAAKPVYDEPYLEKYLDLKIPFFPKDQLSEIFNFSHFQGLKINVAPVILES